MNELSDKKISGVEKWRPLKTTKVDELILKRELKNVPKSPGWTVMSLQTKTMCCQCDYHSYVNDLGETKNMKKEINI